MSTSAPEKMSPLLYLTVVQWPARTYLTALDSFVGDKNPHGKRLQ